MSKTYDQKITDMNIQWHKSEAYYYDVIHPAISSIFEQRRLKTELKKLVSEINTTKPILDLGSGTGNIIKILRELGVEAIACDISPDMLVENPAKVKVLCNAAHLPFSDNYFGCIISYSVFHHFPNPSKVIEEICRVSDSNCILYLDHDPFAPKTKFRPFTKKHLIGWIFSLIIHPSKTIKLLKYIIYGRKKHIKNIANLQESEDLNRLNVPEMIKILEDSGFKVRIRIYGDLSYLKAYKEELK